MRFLDIALSIFMIGILLIGIVAFTALLQYLKLFILRRWVRRIKWPEPCGYCRNLTVRVSEPIELCLHSSQPLSVELSRWGAHGPEVVSTWKTKSVRQANRYNMWSGCRWEPSLTIPTDDLQPGLYILALRPQDKPSAPPYQCVAIVQPTEPAKLAVVSSTNTWQAYNAFGGLSNYRDTATPWPLRGAIIFARFCNLHWVFGIRHKFPMTPLPLQRPNTEIHDDLAQRNNPDRAFSHLIRSEVRLIEFLEQQGLSYTLYSDDNFGFSPEPSQAELIIFSTHSEYWTQEAEARLARYLHVGGRVAFLSGNNIYRGVQRLDGALAVTRQWTDSLRVAALLGCYYDARGYMRYAPYRVEQPDHWVFAGTGLSTGEVFGESRYGGASGYETDKPCDQSADFQILAIGTDFVGPAHMVFRDTPEGGWIFNAASVAFNSSLSESKHTQRIVLNLVERALNGTTPQGE